MRLANGVFGFIFVAFILVEIFHGRGHGWHLIAYGAGGTLSLLSLKPNYPPYLLRAFAASGMALMLLYFSMFFASNVSFNNPVSHFSYNALNRPLISAIAAFAMIPIIAKCSCRLKARTSEVSHPAPANAP